MRGPVHTVESGMFVRTRAGRPPRIVFVHGLGESGLCFETIIGHAALADRAVLVPDLPGYGRSAWAEEPLSLVSAADHLADWLRGRGEGPVVVVGHSMGGVVGLLLAERHAGTVAALVDVDGNKSLADCVYSRPATEQSAEEFAARGFDALRDEVYRLDDPAHRGYYASLRLADPRALRRNARELVDLSRPETMAGRLAALPMPACYIAGAPGGVSPRSRELLDDAGVRVIEIRPSGHWPFIDRPDRFAAALARFLESS